MKIMQVTAQVGRAETAAVEVLVLTHCEGEALAKQDMALLDRALGGSLSKLVQSKEFEGKANEVLLYHTHSTAPAKRLLLVGLGKKHEVTLETIRQALGSAAKRVRQSLLDAPPNPRARFVDLSLSETGLQLTRS